MQLRLIENPYQAWHRFKGGEKIYTKIWGIDPRLIDPDSWNINDFLDGHFQFYEGITHEEISAENFIEINSKEDSEYFIGKEKYAIFGMLELKTEDGRFFEINIENLKKCYHEKFTK